MLLGEKSKAKNKYKMKVQVIDLVGSQESQLKSLVGSEHIITNGYIMKISLIGFII